ARRRSGWLSGCSQILPISIFFPLPFVVGKEDEQKVVGHPGFQPWRQRCSGGIFAISLTILSRIALRCAQDVESPRVSNSAFKKAKSHHVRLCGASSGRTPSLN